jgi:aminopeptidase N
MKRIATAVLFLLFLLLPAVSGRADSYTRQPSIDVEHYEILVELTDASDSFTGTAKIDVAIRSERASGMWLDLAGMHVDRLRVAGIESPFTHHDGKLSFKFDREYSRDETVKIEVEYHGAPGEAGMRIGENRYGRRVFFTDNWPDFAGHWFPSIDHPSDKAAVDFVITAPKKYAVVANGSRAQTESLPNGRTRTRWTERNAIPTYSMAVGVAEFITRSGGKVSGVPVSWYVFPQDTEAAALKFSRTGRILRYFSELIGPYPFEKLAHVESNTRMAAMDNANAIFYSEALFQPLPFSDDPVPHEIAHQWFGNSVTPADWDHLWLSEGFATYFDALFYEQAPSAVSLKESMARFAESVFSYPPSRSRPVVDPELTDIMKKLNPLSYEKGAWILHMLRGILGDETFFKGIRSYYRIYKGRNVWTEDFRKAMESAGGGDLSAFFRQWLYQPGWPEYQLSWDWIEKDASAEITIRQMQDTGLFDMPMDIVLSSGSRKEAHRVRIKDREHTFRMPLKSPPAAVEIDPDGWILKSVSAPIK